jgi:hypothetical protein
MFAKLSHNRLMSPAMTQLGSPSRVPSSRYGGIRAAVGGGKSLAFDGVGSGCDQENAAPAQSPSSAANISANGKGAAGTAPARKQAKTPDVFGCNPFGLQTPKDPQQQQQQQQQRPAAQTAGSDSNPFDMAANPFDVFAVPAPVAAVPAPLAAVAPAAAPAAAAAANPFGPTTPAAAKGCAIAANAPSVLPTPPGMSDWTRQLARSGSNGGGSGGGGSSSSGAPTPVALRELKRATTAAAAGACPVTPAKSGHLVAVAGHAGVQELLVKGFVVSKKAPRGAWHSRVLYLGADQHGVPKLLLEKEKVRGGGAGGGGSGSGFTGAEKGVLLAHIVAIEREPEPCSLKIVGEARDFVIRLPSAKSRDTLCDRLLSFVSSMGLSVRSNKAVA